MSLTDSWLLVAAPQVGGFAAYFSDEPDSGPFTAMGVKTMIVDHGRDGDANDGRDSISNAAPDLLCTPASPRKSRRKVEKLSVRDQLKLEVARESIDQNPRLETVYANGQLQSSKIARVFVMLGYAEPKWILGYFICSTTSRDIYTAISSARMGSCKTQLPAELTFEAGSVADG
ncbi:hypothetical protein MMC29_001694 [Sticta canariensis]|nr:hypothetical protein [Sticta canariensis]